MISGTRKILKGVHSLLHFRDGKRTDGAKNRPNEKEPRSISWEKMTKFVDFLKIDVIREMPTKILNVKNRKNKIEKLV